MASCKSPLFRAEKAPCFVAKGTPTGHITVDRIPHRTIDIVKKLSEVCADRARASGTLSHTMTRRHPTLHAG